MCHKWVVALLAAFAPCLVFAYECRAPGDGEPASTSIDPAGLAAFIDATVGAAMREDGIAGVSVAVVGKAGPLLIKGFGAAGADRPVDTDTLFAVQSISKTLVWIALMQLVEQGKIRLEDPINVHLPASLQIPDEGFSQPILIRDLIDHTAGFEDSALGHLFVQHPESLLPLDEYLARFRVHRVREPGKIQIYSNYGAALGGALVAHVSGVTWEDYAEQRIIRPLGMGEATFRQPYSDELAQARALPAPMSAVVATHLTDGFKRGTAGLEAAPREFTADFPAGSLVASATSMGTYMTALLNPDLMECAGVLRRQTLLAMRAPLFRGAAGFGDMRFGFQPIALPSNLDAFGHGGDSIYQVASMTLIPGAGIGIFMGSNTSSGRRLTVRLPEEFAAKFLGGELAPPVYGPGSYQEARSYAGNYRDLRRAYFRTERGLYDLMIGAMTVSAAPNGDLVVASLLNGPRSLVPLGGGVYRDRGGPARIAFRPLNGSIGLYDPFAHSAWERVGFFDSANAAMGVIALTLLTSICGLVGAGYAVVARRTDVGFENYAAKFMTAAAIAWLIGFLFLTAFLVRALSASSILEIIWWYPSGGLVGACWAFAAAAALTLASVPSVAVVARSNDWSIGRKSTHAIAVFIYVACAATLWRLGFVGFSGW
jgi:CubicO group peptidase (beta-lactamase class C family)